MTEARQSHKKALKRIMSYIVNTASRGLYLCPTKLWDGKKGFEFIVGGMSDSEYAKDELRHSVNGWSTWMFSCCITKQSKMIPIVALSVTKAELYLAVLCAQDMIFIWRLLLSLGLKVKLPMILEVDNKGAFKFVNGWSVAGQTRRIEKKAVFSKRA